MQILNRVAEAWGNPNFTLPMTRQDPESGSAVGITEAENCPAEGLSSWATISASEFVTGYTTSSGKQIRVEFVIAIDGRWEFIGNSLAGCAFLLGAPNSVGPGTIYRGAVSKQYGATTTPHLMAVTPFCWRDFEPLVTEDAFVTWLQLVPVTEAEANYCLNNGYAALDELFDREQPDLFSIDRVSAV